MGKFVQKQNQAQTGNSIAPAESRKMTPKSITDEHPILRLQRTIGNQAVLRLLRSQGLRSASTGAPADGSEQEAERNVPQVDHIHEAASKGVAGPSAPLPHLDAIRRSFGRHDVSGVEAHLGPQATDANQAIDAVGYATGNHVAFSGTPDLHTAAHEAAHVVQQRSGVQLPGGIGEAGDAYETHADAVAALVVKGKQAGPLLDQTPGHAGRHGESAGGAGAVQKSDQPVQMQRAPEQTQKETEQPTGDPIAKLQTSFQALLEKQALMEKVNGPMARALAKAYVNRTGKRVELHATPYTADRVKPGAPKKWGEEEVYKALVGALDFTQMGKAWMPVSGPEVPTGGGVWLEVGKYVVSDFIGGTDIKGIAWSQAKDATLELSVGWLERKGLVAIAEIATGVGAILGFFDFVCTTLELLIWMQKNSKKEMKLSKDEIIVGDVKAWLQETQEEAEAAKKAAQEEAEAARRAAQEKESRSKPLKFEITPAVRATTKIGP